MHIRDARTAWGRWDVCYTRDGRMRIRNVYHIEEVDTYSSIRGMYEVCVSYMERTALDRWGYVHHVRDVCMYGTYRMGEVGRMCYTGRALVSNVPRGGGGMRTLHAGCVHTERTAFGRWDALLAVRASTSCKESTLACSSRLSQREVCPLVPHRRSSSALSREHENDKEGEEE